MIDCIFTIDYEIYGNGEGALQPLVLDPTRRLVEIFDKAGVPFVCFVEALEFEAIEKAGIDPASGEVRRQVREIYERGFEIALHLHPQWARAQLVDSHWELDYDEYNLCTLGTARITEIVDRAIAYLRDVVGDPGYKPFSFRAGNWLFQPTRDAARVLASRGVKVDSSVFKGGAIRAYDLDYRPAVANGHHWTFGEDVNVPDPAGQLLEIPIHSQLVGWWRMLTPKRVWLQRKSAARGGMPNGKRLRASSGTGKSNSAPRVSRLNRIRDYLRWSYPLKFDFCRMTFSEMAAMIETVLREDAQDPERFRPMIAIGHSKDLVDFEAIEEILAWLKSRNIPVNTLKGIYSKCESR